MAGKRPPKNPFKDSRGQWRRKAVMTHACEVIATTPVGLAVTLQRGHEGHELPPASTVRSWMLADPELHAMWVQAKEQQTWALADELIDIAYDESRDRIEHDGRMVPNTSAIQRDRLRVDTIKWTMGRLKPKQWGDKVQTEHSGTIGISQILDDLDGGTTGLPPRAK